METATLTLADFLLARIAEDEAVARTAAPGPWSYGDIDSVAGGSLCDPGVMIASVHWDNDRPDPRIRRFRPVEQADRTGEHIARHDPARVLAECEAKRRIVEQLWGYIAQPDPASSDPSGMQALWIVKTLALPYASHPDYRSEWAV